MNIFPWLTRLSARALVGLSLLFNLPFAVLQIHGGAFDTYIHIFLADHYRRSWFDLWEPRWYLGFSMASYPPLVHQLIALLSWPLTAVQRWFSPTAEPYPGAWQWAGEESAYVVVLLAVLAAFPVVVRAFARLFVGPGAASLAGLLAILLPGLSLVLWSFGQLPSVTATAVVLLAMTRGHAFLLRGRLRHLVQAVCLAGLAAAIHHGVFLMVPFVGTAVVAQAAMQQLGPSTRRTPGSTTAPRRGLAAVTRQAAPLPLRLALWVGLSGLLVAAVLWPLLAWSRGQDIQVPIDHLSRHNLLGDIKAALFFFWPIYGPLVLALPWIGWAAVRVRHHRLLVPAALALALLVMGLGGTTRLPELLYGAGWEWLTYERFAFWAATVLAPLTAAGLVFIGRRVPLAAGLFLGSMLIAAILAGGFATLIHSQPPRVDLAPIATFLNQPEQRPYRYFTLGFGDQLARLSAITTNGTPDGTYHTARGLPELRNSGIGAIDTVMWSHRAYDAGPFLAQADRYGARWAFSNHEYYPDVLRAAGWRYRFDVGTVQVWEKAGVLPVRIVPPPGLNGSPAALWWGLCPLSMLALAGLALAVDWPWNAWRAAWTRPRLAAGVRALRVCGWGVTVALLAFWWYHAAYQGTTPWVYFIYQSALIFACDLAAVATLALWLAERALRGGRLRLGPRAVLLGIVGLIAAGSLSLTASTEPSVTRALVGHLMLLGTWYIMLVNDPPPPRVAGAVLAGTAAVQGLVAIAQAATQSSMWLGPLNLPWPGPLDPAVPGVSVVETATGQRWLRAYGTLSHPNILGGYLLPGLAAALERLRSTNWRGWLVVGWVIVTGLLLSFSRSAWLAAAVMAAVGAWLLVLRRQAWPEWRRLRRWAAAGLGALGLIGLPLLPMLAARADLSGQLLRLERRSMDDRIALSLVAADMLRDRPLTGVGAGAFVVRLYQVKGGDLPLEPAHNVPLLLAAEMGGPGLAALGLLLAGAAWRGWRRRRRAALAEAALGATLVGILAISLLDHYWWTMPPARLAWVTLLGLWVGWGEAGAATLGENRERAGSAQRAR